MRKMLVVVLFVVLNLFQHLAVAQSSYTIEPIPFIPFSFTQGDTLILSDDKFSRALPIGFDFCFFGETYDSILISPNSYITFNLDSAGAYSPWHIIDTFPSPSLPDKAIMCPWQDLNPASGGQISYFIFGVAPCRKFVVSYTSVAMWSCTTLYFSNQVVLYEGSNIIETYIGNKPICPTWNDGAAVHGLSNDSIEAVIVPGRNYPTVWQVNNDAYRFTPLTCGNNTNACEVLSDSSFTIITGRLFIDENDNCIYDTDEEVLDNYAVTISPMSDFTDQNGVYIFTVFDTGTYQLNYVLPPDMQASPCQQNTVVITALGDTVETDLIAEPLQCSDIYTSVTIPEFIPCDTVEIEIRLTNYGVIPTGNIDLTVTLPPELMIVDCNCAYTTSLNQLFIDLSSIDPDDFYTPILLDVVVSCNSTIDAFICINTVTTTQAVDCVYFPSSYDACMSITSSINTIEPDKIKIFPNPATTQLTITGYTPAYLTLCNTHGQTVAEASNTNTLWLGNLPQGLYLLQLYDAKGGLVKTEKVVKE